MRILGSSLALVALMVVACKAAPADETDGSEVTSSSDGETETGEIIIIDMGGDGDGDDEGCSDLEILCPDGTCQYGGGTFPEYACCDHGGACPEQCLPQDASGSEPDCLDPRYAWTGDSCAAICGCEGSDCDAIYDSAIACFLAYPPPCGPDYASCPFEPPLGPTMITGVTAEGPNTYAYGVFGTITGEGLDEHPHLRFAADPVSLAEHVPHLFNPPVTPECPSE